MRKVGQPYGSVFTFFMPLRAIVLNDYDSIKECLVKQADAFAGRPHNVMTDLLYKGHSGIIGGLAENFN